MATVIGGVVRDYEWGIVDGLVPWSGRATGRPQAELWFGAHPSAPSPILSTYADPGELENGFPTDLDRGSLTDAHEVPLLVKLLAAAQPLSVQVHPRAELASAWWASQQASGAEQVLADSHEKTELLVALSPFEAFVGWRPIADTTTILSHIPSTAEAVRLLSSGDRRAAIRSLLAIEDHAEAASRLPGAAEAAGLTQAECAAYEMVVKVYPGDSGAVLTAMLAHVSLRPGSAIFVPAGVPHSYIRGLGLEIMTTSDNVLRLGLTPKPIFISKALEALDDEAAPQVIRAEFGEAITPVGAPFEVTIVGAGTNRAGAGTDRAGAGTDRVGTGVVGAGDDGIPEAGRPGAGRPGVGQSGAGRLGAGQSTGQRLQGSMSSEPTASDGVEVLPSGRFRMCLAIEGAATITTDDVTVTLKQGTAAVLSAGEPTARVSSTGLVALVSDRGTFS